ncbi:hypothetical protein [Formosa maritima]|uniref:Uncharacterized protein n=1 Tax=Formosa maritima TaxID=2592046 RepID=A0A5D0G9A1_9FLAO|nr:hypothetical protein [Formosa maritima]TYA55271.1 hypothetical protein FVF61_07455 [Formosa maritima]
MTQIGFPVNANFFELRLDVISFDFEGLTYQRVSAEPAVIDRNFVGDAIQLIISELPTGSGVCFAMARIAFYHEVHGERYLLSGDGAFGVEILGIRE